MRPPGPKFWLLGDGLKWPTQRNVGLGVSAQRGLSLAEDPAGPLGLRSADGSVGRLALPKGMALDNRLILYFLDRGDLRIRRFDPETQSFPPLPFLGGRGSARREFGSLDAIAFQGPRMYVADAENKRVQAFHIQTLALVAEWTSLDVSGGWTPADLACAGQALYILDCLNRRVLRTLPWNDELEPVIASSDPAENWLRIIADRTGLLYVLADKNGAASLRAYDASNPAAPIEIFREPASVRDRFDTPSILMDAKGRFRMPASLRVACARSLPEDVPPPELPQPASNITPRAVKRFGTEHGYYELDREQREVRIFTAQGQLRSRFGPRDANGRLVSATDVTAWDPADLRGEGECVYILDQANKRVWRHRFGSDFLELDTEVQPWQAPVWAPSVTSTVDLWFDAEGDAIESPDFSSISNIRLYYRDGFWLSNPIQSEIHRCQWDRMQLTLAPPPPGAKVEVLTFTQDAVNFSLAEEDPRWNHCFTYVAPLEPLGNKPPADVDVDFLIQSRPAENLSIQIRLYGDGYETAMIKALRVYYPRDSYAQYLPKVFLSQDDMRRFLEGFLGAMQLTGDSIERSLQTIERLFDPDAVPEGSAMRYLASWLCLNLEGAWSAEQNRKLLSAVPKIYPHRGTPQGLRDFIRIYLANAANLKVEEVRVTEFPFVLEGFAERKGLMLNASDGALWGPGAVGRLQLGENSVAGEVSLVSTGDPNLDFFASYAHHFKVFVPAAWIRTPDQQSLIRRAIEAEKPAHTAYELVLVENRMRVGTQSTVGFDTIVGGPVELRLPCEGERGRLNVDTVLGRGPDAIAVSAGEMIVT